VSLWLVHVIVLFYAVIVFCVIYSLAFVYELDSYVMDRIYVGRINKGLW